MATTQAVKQSYLSHVETGNQIMNNRAGEQGKIPTRSGRFIKKEGYWYYSTREGVDIGPFDSKNDAEVGAIEFIDFICASEPAVLATLRQYRAA
jgi:hypothetical protein